MRLLDSIIKEHGGLIQTGPFGSQLKQAEYTDRGVPVVMPKDISAGSISTDEIARVSETKADQLVRHFLKEGTIIFPRRGDIGKCALITEKEEGYLCGTGCIKIELPKEQLDPQFFYYYLIQPNITEWLERNAIGSTMLNLNTSIIGRIQVPDIGIAKQKAIAFILKTYDNLIENNLRRIQLLEESARLLYREWFVHLRFPGHEHVKIVEGVPEGWQKGPILEFGNVITGKTPSTKEPGFYGDGIPFIKTPDMHGNLFIFETESYLTERGSNNQIGKLLPENSLLVSCIGTVGVVSITTTPSQFNQQINAVIPREGYLLYYCLFAFKDLKPRLEAISAGATMANVSKGKFETLDILQPPEIVLKEFDSICRTVFSQIKILMQQSQKAKAARDLLLPRLMSGAISV